MSLNICQFKIEPRMPLLLDAVNFQFSLWRRFRTTADDDDNNNENDNRQHTNFDQKSSPLAQVSERLPQVS